MKCCHGNKTMARTCKQNITAGFYKELCEREEIVEDLRLTGSEDNIYEHFTLNSHFISHYNNTPATVRARSAT